MAICDTKGFVFDRAGVGIDKDSQRKPRLEIFDYASIM